MITVDRESPLTVANLVKWIEVWEKDMPRLKELLKYFKNKDEAGNRVLKLPFAKKLIITSASAAAGEGVSLSAPELVGADKETFEAVKKLFKKQTMLSHDRKVLKQGGTFGRAYELVYFSDDVVPIPKVALYPATNAFVVFDDTVEKNSLYGICINGYEKKGEKRLKVYIYDSELKYEADIPRDKMSKPEANWLFEGVPHNLGRMPLTEYHNNEEEQGDFEQIIDLMLDRTDIHNLNMKDMKAIAKNYMKSRNVELAGKTDEEKIETTQKMSDAQRIEFSTDGVDPLDDIGLLSKNENYTSVDIFGEDITSKIYDLSMIPDLSAEQFAGNQTGVALELKLMPFKQMVADKDEEIERLYRRRLKMYIHALSMRDGLYSELDVSDIEVNINRNWSKNIAELAMLISSLFPTGLFSDEYLTNKMPDADYDQEKARLEQERDEKAKKTKSDPNNSSTEWLASLIQGQKDSRVIALEGEQGEE